MRATHQPLPLVSVVLLLSATACQSNGRAYMPDENGEAGSSSVGGRTERSTANPSTTHAGGSSTQATTSAAPRGGASSQSTMSEGGTNAQTTTASGGAVVSAGGSNSQTTPGSGGAIASLGGTSSAGGTTAKGGSTSAPPACLETEVRCASSCVNPATDTKNCGSCGHDCGAGSACAAGQCQPAALRPDLTVAQGLDVSAAGLYLSSSNLLLYCPTPANCSATSQQIGSVGQAATIAVTKTLATNLLAFDGKVNPSDKFAGYNYCPVTGCGGLSLAAAGNSGYLGGLVAVGGDFYYHTMVLAVGASTSFLYRAPGTSGGTVGTLVTIGNQVAPNSSIVLDDQYAYFVRTDAAGSNPTVVACDRLVGCNSYTALLPAIPANAAAYNGRLYFTNGNQLWNVDAAAPASVAKIATLSTAPTGEMLVDGTNVYWLSATTLQYCALPSCAGGLKTLVSGQTNASKLHHYGNYLYWLATGTTTTGPVFRVVKP